MGCGGSREEGHADSLEKRFHGKRDLSQMQITMGYFCDTAAVKQMLKFYPELMLLPWEYQRAMGLVKAANPMLTKYTFLTHQWEAPGHPFADLKQLTEHISLVNTPWFWCDWYCVPQWSRSTTPYPADPLSIMIFGTTMKSFHLLCTHATDAIAVVKRGEGLKMRGFDQERGWKIDAELMLNASAADEDITKAGHGVADLREVAKAVSGVGVDLEYGVRAWCALERCFLPNTAHKDVRLVRLLGEIEKLEKRALKHRAGAQAAETETKGKSGTADHDDVATSSLAQLLNAIERLKGLVDLCLPSDANRLLYMNAWSYNYLKKCVLTITNPADYQYLDVLMVADVQMGSYGNLYLQSIADDDKPLLQALAKLEPARPEKLVEPRVFWPAATPSPTLTLDTLLGLSAGAEKTGVHGGELGESFGGLRLVKVENVELEKKRCFITISDAGLLGTTPNVTEMEVQWKGSRSNILALIVKNKSIRVWTFADRAAHAKQLRVAALSNQLKSSGLAA